MKHKPHRESTLYITQRLTFCLFTLLCIFSCSKQNLEDMSSRHTGSTIDNVVQDPQERSKDLISVLSRHIIHCSTFEEYETRALTPSSKSSISRDSLDKEAEQVAKLLTLQTMYFEGEKAPHGVLVYPQSVKDSLFDLSEIAFAPDENLLLKHIASYQASDVFSSYSKPVQAEILAKMEIMRVLRRTIIKICDEREIEVIKRSMGLKMSPGDRMIWSEAVKQMTPCQRDVAMQLTLYGIGLGVAPSSDWIEHIVRAIQKYADAGHCKLQKPPFHIGSSHGRPPLKGKAERPPHQDRDKQVGPPPRPKTPEDSSKNEKKPTPVDPPSRPSKPEVPPHTDKPEAPPKV